MIRWWHTVHHYLGKITFPDTKYGQELDTEFDTRSGHELDTKFDTRSGQELDTEADTALDPGWRWSR